MLFMLFFACLLIIAPNLSPNPNGVEATQVLTIHKGESLSISIYVYVCACIGSFCSTSIYRKKKKAYAYVNTKMHVD